MFQPTLAGLYQVAITYGGVPVKGSPLALGVGPVGPTPPPRAVGKGLEVGRIGERISFTVTSVVQPRVSVEAVEGNIDVHIQSPKPGEYLISYTPKWIGVYDIIISIGPNDVSYIRLFSCIIFLRKSHFYSFLDHHSDRRSSTLHLFDSLEAGVNIWTTQDE